MIKIGIVLSFALILCISLDRISPNPRAVIWSDAEGYYKYLPGLFILKDFHQLDPGSVFPYYNQQGEYVNKYSCGVAYLYIWELVGMVVWRGIWTQILCRILCFFSCTVSRTLTSDFSDAKNNLDIVHEVHPCGAHGL